MTNSKKLTELERLYNLLLVNHLGFENRIKARDLAVVTGKSVRQLRACCEAINRDSRFERLISTCGAIYLCKSKDECARAIAATYKQGITLINKARAMERKLGAHGQVLIDGENYTVVYDSAK